jgi:EAL domain-containing protein (putative c-di-GMP-specific phosphodiesterase class I)
MSHNDGTSSKFPFVKIDRTFIQDLGRGPEDEAIAAAVIGLGRSLHLHVTAEGVETQAQRLRQLGCDHAQGFFYGPPVPGAAVGGLV